MHIAYDRLRQVDVKAEHFERQVARAEAERDVWEKKYEVGYHRTCIHQESHHMCPVTFHTNRPAKRNSRRHRPNSTSWPSPWTICSLDHTLDCDVQNQWRRDILSDLYSLVILHVTTTIFCPSLFLIYKPIGTSLLYNSQV